MTAEYKKLAPLATAPRLVLLFSFWQTPINQQLKSNLPFGFTIEKAAAVEQLILDSVAPVENDTFSFLSNRPTNQQRNVDYYKSTSTERITPLLVLIGPHGTSPIIEIQVRLM